MRCLDFLGTSIARDPRIIFQYMLALDMSTTVRVIRNETGVFFSFPISIKMKRFFPLGLSICSLNVHVTMK